MSKRVYVPFKEVEKGQAFRSVDGDDFIRIPNLGITIQGQSCNCWNITKSVWMIAGEFEAVEIVELKTKEITAVVPAPVVKTPKTSKHDIMSHESMFDSMIHELESLQSQHSDFPAEFSDIVREGQGKLQKWMEKHGMSECGGDPDEGKENW